MLTGTGDNNGIEIWGNNVTVKNCKLKNFRFALRPGSNQNIENIYCEDVSDTCIHGGAGGEENITITNLEVKQTFPTSWSGFFTGANGMRNVYIRNVYAYAPSPIERVLGFRNSINITVENVTAINISMVVGLEDNNSDVRIRDIKAWGDVNVGNHFLPLSNSQNVEIENVELFNTDQSGILMEGMKNVVVRNATVYNANRCIELNNVENVTISNSTFHDAGFRIIGGGYGLRTVKNVTIENVYAYNSADQFVNFHNCENVTVTNSTAYQTTGVRFNNCANINVTAITLSNTDKEAWSQSENVENVIIKDNNILAYGTTSDSYIFLAFSNSTNVIVEGNYLYSECSGSVSTYSGIWWGEYNYNITVRNNQGQTKNNTDACAVGVAIIPSVASKYNENFEFYNNTFSGPTVLFNLQVTSGKNFKVYNNTFERFIIAGGVYSDITDSYIYNNTANEISFATLGYCLRNIYAYNNTYNSITYYPPLCGENIFVPDTTTIEPFIELTIPYTTLDFGKVYINNTYTIPKTITINTNLIDYKISLESTGLYSDTNVITQDNLKFGKEGETYPLPLDITFLKQFTSVVASVVHQLYVPPVPFGNYTGTITIIASSGFASTQTTI